MSARVIVSAQVLQAYVRDEAAGRGLDSMLERVAEGAQELWITGIGALIAAMSSQSQPAQERLGRVLRAATLMPVGAQLAAAAAVARTSAEIDELERRMGRNLRGAVFLVKDPAGWGTTARTFETLSDGSPGKVPLVDLTAQLASIGSDINDAIWRTLSASAFILGDEVRHFEAEFSAACGGASVVGVNSGTDAIHLGLRAMRIGAGDAVLTVSLTFIATAEAIVMAGAQPLFVDVADQDYTMSPTALSDWLEQRARKSGGEWHDTVTGLRLKAIMPVHLHGQPARMEALKEIALRYGLAVIEDACQAHRAEARVDGEWLPAGKLGDGAAFSFFPGKNLGAYGDAGAFATVDKDLADRIRKLRDHGRLLKYEHEWLGWNSRLDALQAAILRVKLKHLEKWTAARRAAAQHYHTLLAALPGVTPPIEREDARHVYHLYVVTVESSIREPLMKQLGEEGIETGIHYPIPAHRQPAMREHPGAVQTLPVTDAAASRVLSLPIYPEIPADVQRRVVFALSRGLMSVQR